MIQRLFLTFLLFTFLLSIGPFSFCYAERSGISTGEQYRLRERSWSEVREKRQEMRSPCFDRERDMLRERDKYMLRDRIRERDREFNKD